VVSARDEPPIKRIKEADALVGSRIRERRLQLGLTQENVAAVLGVTFQQLQKYERGFNRVGASRLVDMARALGVQPSYFFDALPATHETKQSLLEAELLTDFRSLRSHELREAAVEMVRLLCRATNKKSPGPAISDDP